MRTLLAALAALALSACIEESPFAHQGQPRGPHQASSPAPEPQNDSSASSSAATPSTAAPAQAPQGTEQVKQAGAIFGGTLQVAGYRIDPPQAKAGQTVTVNVFLRALGPIATDDMMFVHVDDAEGRPVRINGDHWPAGHKLPMPQWKAGEVVRDSFQVTLTGFEESNAATIWMGFWEPNSDQRLPLSNAGQVKNDGNNRYALADIPIVR